MYLGQYANFHINGANSFGVATINTWFTADNTAADNILFQLFEGVLEIFLGWTLFFVGQLGNGAITQCVNRSHSLLLVYHLVGGIQIAANQFSQGSLKLNIFRFSFPVPTGLARFLSQLLNHRDYRLHFLVGVEYSTQHSVFRQFASFGLNHQYRIFGTSYHHIQR